MGRLHQSFRMSQGVPPHSYHIHQGKLSGQIGIDLLLCIEIRQVLSSSPTQGSKDTLISFERRPLLKLTIFSQTRHCTNENILNEDSSKSNVR